MNIESFVHGISQIPKAFFGALAQGERTISKLLNAFLDEKKNQNDNNDCSGFCNAEDIFILILYCEDAENLTDNINLIMKVIKKEQRTFKNLVNILNKLYEDNVNNCQSFLTIDKINEVINACTDFIEEEEE